MGNITRRQFAALSLVGSLGFLARAARGLAGDLPPTHADPAVPEGACVRIQLPNGRIVSRVCRRGYWVTARPAR